MTWTAFLLAALKALPQVLSLIQQIKSAADAAQQRGIGYDLAVAGSLKHVAESAETARKAAQQADKDHAAHPNDDGGFDHDFVRKD